MAKGLAQLAQELGIPPDELPARIGVSAKAIALIDKGHAVFIGANARIVAQRLHTTEARVREAMSVKPEPRSADMERRLEQFAAEVERQVRGAKRFSKSRVDRIAAECFPDELERKQVLLYSDPPGWKHAQLDLGPVDENGRASGA